MWRILFCDLFQCLIKSGSKDSLVSLRPIEAKLISSAMQNMTFHSLVLVLILIDSILSIDANLRPQLVSFAERRSQKLGTNTKFFCSVQEGTGPFRFEWRKNDLLLLPSDHRIETNQDESTLMIAKLSLDDSGNYSCTVRNSFGDDTQQTVLSVKGLPFSLENYPNLYNFNQIQSVAHKLLIPIIYECSNLDVSYLNVAKLQEILD